MVIQKAQPDDTRVISTIVNEYFKDENKLLSFEYYETDFMKAFEAIQKRISDKNSDFHYFVARESLVETKILGISTLLLEDSCGEICIIAINKDLPQTIDKKAISEALFQHGVEFLRRNRSQSILVEVSKVDANLIDKLTVNCATRLSTNYLIWQIFIFFAFKKTSVILFGTFLKFLWKVLWKKVLRLLNWFWS